METVPSSPEQQPSSRMQQFCAKHHLSPREREVLEQLCRGQHPKAIGDMIGASYASVRTHLRRIYKKVGCSGVRELVIRYFSTG